MNYEIVDNFLPRSNLKYLKEMTSGENFPWFLNEQKVDSENNLKKNCVLLHPLYQYNVPVSELFTEMEIILKRLDCRSLINAFIKVELISETIIEKKPIIQFPFPYNTAIFYLNNTDGYTLLKSSDETTIKIENVQNRILMFDDSVSYVDTNCTKDYKKVNIIFNYL